MMEEEEVGVSNIDKDNLMVTMMMEQFLYQLVLWSCRKCHCWEIYLVIIFLSDSIMVKFIDP